MNSATASSTPSIPRSNVPASVKTSSLHAHLAELKIASLSAEKLTSPAASSESTEGRLMGEIARLKKIDVRENASRGAEHALLSLPPRFMYKAQVHPNTCLDYSTRIYGATQDYYLTVSGITGVSPTSLGETTGIPPFTYKVSLEGLESFFETVGYSGTIIGFGSIDAFSAYVLRAVEKAPKLTLKLILGYVIEGEGPRICMIKAWAAHSKRGVPLFVKMAPGSPDDRMLKPRMHHLLVDYTHEGTPINRPDSLFTLTPCKQFWLYETGKRYRKVPQIKNS